jgi:hypothetical protein
VALKGCGRKHIWPILRYYHSIFLEGIGRAIEICARIRNPYEDVDHVSSKYEACHYTLMVSSGPK